MCLNWNFNYGNIGRSVRKTFSNNICTNILQYHSLETFSDLDKENSKVIWHTIYSIFNIKFHANGTKIITFVQNVYIPAN